VRPTVPPHLVAVVALTAAVASGGCGEATAAPGAVPLLEDAACGAPAAESSGRTEGGRATVSVDLPGTAVLLVDARQRVTGAWTNTGCAPRPHDDVWVQEADGSLRRADATGVIAVQWRGDFRHRGVVVPQT
jgi:hypothetical protein